MIVFLEQSLRAAVRRPTSPKGGGKAPTALSKLNDNLAIRLNCQETFLPNPRLSNPWACAILKSTRAFGIDFGGTHQRNVTPSSGIKSVDVRSESKESGSDVYTDGSSEVRKSYIDRLQEKLNE